MHIDCLEDMNLCMQMVQDTQDDLLPAIYRRYLQLPAIYRRYLQLHEEHEYIDIHAPPCIGTYGSHILWSNMDRVLILMYPQVNMRVSSARHRL